jgi:ATP-dependent helicase HrpA
MLSKKELLRRPAAFKLILMTARIDADAMKAYFYSSSGPAVSPNLAPKQLVVREVAVHGRRYAVQRLFLEDTTIKHNVGSDPALTISVAVAWIFTSYRAGDVLVFVADVAEINACVGALVKLRDCAVCPLHANSDDTERHSALTPHARLYKIIVATNVAETSLTIPGVKYVINCGMEKNPPTLKKELASKSSQLQREGRSGRDEDVLCLMMMPASAFGMLPEFRLPETQRLPLRSLALLCLARGYIDNSNNFEDFVQRLPSPPAAELCAESIADLNAFEFTVAGQLTVLGGSSAEDAS